jgi:hypothetical protein
MGAGAAAAVTDALVSIGIGAETAGAIGASLFGATAADVGLSEAAAGFIAADAAAPVTLASGEIISPALASGLAGVSPAAAGAIGAGEGAALGSTSSAIQGQNPLTGAVGGALTGGAMGGLGGGSGLINQMTGAGTLASDISAGGLGGTAGALATGQNPGMGALTGAGSGAISGLMSQDWSNLSGASPNAAAPAPASTTTTAPTAPGAATTALSGGGPGASAGVIGGGTLDPDSALNQTWRPDINAPMPAQPSWAGTDPASNQGSAWLGYTPPATPTDAAGPTTLGQGANSIQVGNLAGVPSVPGATVNQGDPYAPGGTYGPPATSPQTKGMLASIFGGADPNAGLPDHFTSAVGQSAGAAGAPAAAAAGGAAKPNWLAGLSSDVFGGDPSSTLNTGIGKALGVLPAAGVMGAQMLMGQQQPKGYNQLMSQANQAQQEETTLLNEFNSGTLPAWAQQALQSSAASAKAAVQSRYAAMGQSGTASEQQALAQIDMQVATQGGQMLEQLLNAGMQEGQIAGGLYSTLLNNNVKQDTALSSSMGNFASALAGGGGTTLKLGA